MGNPRKPTHILRLAGRLAHDPGRYSDRVNEPTQNEPLGDPDDYMSPDQVRVWHDIKSRLVEGVALESDRTAFAGLVQLETIRRVMPLEPPLFSLWVRLHGLFGMTPADRSRVSVSPQAPGNAFDDLEKIG